MTRCFGEDLLGKCAVLYVKECDKSKCPFYKTVEKAKEDYIKAELRCKRLGIPSNSDYVIWKKAKDLIEQQR